MKNSQVYFALCDTIKFCEISSAQHEPVSKVSPADSCSGRALHCATAVHQEREGGFFSRMYSRLRGGDKEKKKPAAPLVWSQPEGHRTDDAGGGPPFGWPASHPWPDTVVFLFNKSKPDDAASIERRMEALARSRSRRPPRTVLVEGVADLMPKQLEALLNLILPHVWEPPDVEIHATYCTM